MVRFTVLILCFFMGSQALAGDEAGNGGDIIRCAQGSSRVFETLDHYEARVRFGLDSNLYNLSGDEWQIAQAVIDLIEPFDSERHRLYTQWLESFWSETLPLSNVTLVDIPDSAHIAIPNGCEIIQLIVQKKPEFPQEARYTLNETYWQQMNAQERASMIIHELILRESMSPYFKNSKSVRYFNAVLTSTAFLKYSMPEYIEALAFAKLKAPKRYEINGITYIGLHRPAIVWGGAGLQLNASYDNVQVKIGGNVVPRISRETVLHRENFSIAYVQSTYQVVSMKLPSGAVHKFLGYWMWFHKNGSLACGQLNEDTLLRKKDGTAVSVKYGDRVYFDEEGYYLESTNSCRFPEK